MSTRHLSRVAAFAVLIAAPTLARSPLPLVGGANSCLTPDPIAGVGAFAFDNTLATSGLEGQATSNCTFYGLTGIYRDVWFTWTAPQTGRISVSTCGQTTLDTKIAVHAGSSCPGPGPALACNDDITSSGVGNYQSKLELDVVAGNAYTIQLGAYPNATSGGTGTFTIDYVGGLQCQHDDGSTDYASEIGTGGVPRASVWMYRLGEVGVATRVTTISSAWGWTATGTPLPLGLTGQVGIWEDPNDDGNPADAVLLARASAPMVGAHTDALQSFVLPSPVVAQGYFFIAAWTVHSTGFPVPRDIGGCVGRPGIGWLLGNEPGDLNVNNLAANTNPPEQAPNGQTYYFLLRADCQPIAQGTPFCLGDGVAPHTACPCANHSATGDAVGCLNSLGLGGRLRSLGNSSLTGDNVVLSGSNMPNSSALYFQGTTQLGAGGGVVFGDGLRCAGGSVVRLKTVFNTAGASAFPGVGDPSVSVRGLVTSPGDRTYQVWYRNAASFCSASTFNLSNGLRITWTP